MRPGSRSFVAVVFFVCATSIVCVAQATRASAVIDATALLHDLRVLSADDMQGRRMGTAGGLKARTFLADRFAAIGLRPWNGSFVVPIGGASQGANVVGRIDGARAAQPFLVLSAHYDHLGVENGQIYNGADDNASGTAALLAVAAYFAAHRPEHSIIFAAFDGEEDDLRGSRAFVEHPPVPLAAMAADINLDMVGRDANDTLFAVGVRLNPFLKPYVDRVAGTSRVHLRIGHDTPGQPGVEDWTKDSDHWSFQQANVPAIYLGDEDFAQHHRPTDDYDTMTFDFFIGAAETAVALATEFDRHLDDIARRR